jgi:hypothetical protein
VSLPAGTGELPEIDKSIGKWHGLIRRKLQHHLPGLSVQPVFLNVLACAAERDLDQPFHLIVNVAVDGRFFENTSQRADALAPTAFPQILQVDYIRVYQWAD